MSLELSKSTPPVTAMCDFVENSFELYHVVTGINISIPMDDFCFLVEYILSNTDLFSGDPRIALVDKMQKAQIVPGFNPEKFRIVINENQK